MPAFSARNARIRLEGIDLLGLKWTINTKVDEIDTSNFETFGYTDYTAGLWEADISFDVIHPGGPAIMSTIYPGRVTLSNTDFYLDAGTARMITSGAAIPTASSRFFRFASLLITSVSIDAEVRSFVRVSVTAKNKGQFTFPGV